MNDEVKKAILIVKDLVGQILKNGEVVVASDSKSRLWRDLSMRQAIQNWSMMYADIARGPESALRAFTVVKDWRIS